MILIIIFSLFCSVKLITGAKFSYVFYFNTYIKPLGPDSDYSDEIFTSFHFIYYFKLFSTAMILVTVPNFFFSHFLLMVVSAISCAVKISLKGQRIERGGSRRRRGRSDQPHRTSAVYLLAVPRRRIIKAASFVAP